MRKIIGTAKYKQMVNKTAIKQRRWTDFLSQMESGDVAQFKVQTESHITSLRTMLARFNSMPDRTFKFSMRTSRESKMVYISTMPKF